MKIRSAFSEIPYLLKLPLVLSAKPDVLFQKVQILFFKSQLLISHPKEVLAELSRWLDLKISLSQEYNQFNNTGKTRQGDSSELIKYGKI